MRNSSTAIHLGVAQVLAALATSEGVEQLNTDVCANALVLTEIQWKAGRNAHPFNGLPDGSVGGRAPIAPPATCLHGNSVGNQSRCQFLG